MRTPIHYYSGKYYLIKKLLELIPEHRIYVEPFGGAANLLFAKPPSEVEVYNDIDSNIVNFFRVLRDPIKCGRLTTLLALTPYSREEFYFCRDNLNDPNADDVERARRFFVMNEQSFSGYREAWRYTKARNTHEPRTFRAKAMRLIEFTERLKHVYIENDDFEKVIRRFDSPETFFYCDPPYVPGTIKAPHPYPTMSLEDHKRLVDVLLSIEGKVLLSGYLHEVYRPLEDAGWRRLRVRLPTFAPTSIQTGSKRKYRHEYLWMNYRV